MDLVAQLADIVAQQVAQQVAPLKDRIAELEADTVAKPEIKRDEKAAGGGAWSGQDGKTRAVEMNAFHPGAGGPTFPGPSQPTGRNSILKSRSSFSAGNHVGTNEQVLYLTLKRST